MSRRWNVMIIPNTSARGLTLNVAERTLKIAGIAASVLLIITIAFCAGSAYRWKANHAKIVESLESDINARDAELNKLNEEFARVLVLEDKLRGIAGLKPRQGATGDAAMGGQGGPGVSESLLYPEEFVAESNLRHNPNMPVDELLLAIDAAGASFSEILETFEKEQERLSSIPSINPVYSADAWISSGYGKRKDPIHGKVRFHDGIDIVAPRNTPVIAPADGTVTFAGWHDGLGRKVEIRHEYGYRTVYGHNAKLTVKKGEKVKRGDTIAILGSSGRSTGPHLHYEVRHNGKLTNPYKYVID